MAEEPEDESYFVYEKGFLGHLLEAAGWLLGLICYRLARSGFVALAERWVDTAIVLKRGNLGAIRAVGYLNGLQGKLALRRGRLMIVGRIHSTGPFADKRFYATYDIAARSKDRALELIRRWEWDAIPDSLIVVEGELDHEDPGAEGILWISNGRTLYSEDEEYNKAE